MGILQLFPFESCTRKIIWNKTKPKKNQAKMYYRFQCSCKSLLVYSVLRGHNSIHVSSMLGVQAFVCLLFHRLVTKRARASLMICIRVHFFHSLIIPLWSNAALVFCWYYETTLRVRLRCACLHTIFPLLWHILSNPYSVIIYRILTSWCNADKVFSTCQKVLNLKKRLLYAFPWISAVKESPQSYNLFNMLVYFHRFYSFTSMRHIFRFVCLTKLIANMQNLFE